MELSFGINGIDINLWNLAFGINGIEIFFEIICMKLIVMEFIVMEIYRMQ